MKVKEYLVSEILELKHDIRLLRQDIAKKDDMIKAQRSRIEYFEKREAEFKEHSNQIYGKLCEVRQIISDNMLLDLPDHRPVWLSIQGENGTNKEKDDFDKLLKLLDLREDQTEEQEAPEDHKNQLIPECDFCTYSTPDGTCSRNDCTVGSKFEPVHVCDTCKYIKCPGDEEPCLNCTGDCNKWERWGEDVKTED